MLCMYIYAKMDYYADCIKYTFFLFVNSWLLKLEENVPRTGKATSCPTQGGEKTK